VWTGADRRLCEIEKVASAASKSGYRCVEGEEELWTWRDLQIAVSCGNTVERWKSCLLTHSFPSPASPRLHPSQLPCASGQWGGEGQGVMAMSNDTSP
jgi:hypothetical protein